GSLGAERGPALDCRAARLGGADELEVDEALAAVLVALGDLAGARERVAGPDLLTKLGAEAAHVGGAEPVGRVRGEDAGLEHPDREHRREPRALGVLLVVVDRVEVARRALVPHEVRACERTEVARLGLRALGEVIPRDAHRPQPSVGGLPVSMAVDRISATTLPASSRNSCTVTTNVIVPPRFPSFS